MWRKAKLFLLRFRALRMDFVEGVARSVFVGGLCRFS